MRSSCAVLVVIAACYAPHPPEGAPCDSHVQCPTPLQCLGNRCLLSPPGSSTDAPILSTDSASDGTLSIDGTPQGCSTTGLPCTGGKGSIGCNDDCMVFCDTVVTRQTAADNCTQWGGTLVVVDSAMIEGCIGGPFTPNVWLGLQQANPAPGLALGWTWVDGTPFSYTDWNTGEPDDVDDIENGQEQCAYRERTSGNWIDSSCGNVGVGGVATMCRR